MKILRIIPSMNPEEGGPCRGIRNSIPEMQKLGLENEVVCLDAIDSDYDIKDNFRIHKLGKASNLWSYNKQLIPWLTDYYNNFDVVIVHGLWSYHSYAAIKVINRYRKLGDYSPKIYVMPHGMLDPYFQKAKERRLKAIRNVIYWKLIENKVINQADGILFTCGEELLLARTTFPNYKPNLEINVGYGIQSPPTYSGQMKQSLLNKIPDWNEQPFLLFLSRIHPKKGIDLLLKAYLKLEQELLEIPQLIIAGPGIDTPYGKKNFELAKQSKNILFSGMINGNAKWGAFYLAEAFVLPSHQENFGISVVEAMACETPVLISDKVNIWREIEKGNGGIVRKDTEEETYQMLKKWMTLPKNEKTKMAVAAKKNYQNNFSIEQATLQFVRGISSI